MEERRNDDFRHYGRSERPHDGNPPFRGDRVERPNYKREWAGPGGDHRERGGGGGGWEQQQGYGAGFGPPGKRGRYEERPPRDYPPAREFEGRREYGGGRGGGGGRFGGPAGGGRFGGGGRGGYFPPERPGGAFGGPGGYGASEGGRGDYTPRGGGSGDYTPRGGASFGRAGNPFDRRELPRDREGGPLRDGPLRDGPPWELRDHRELYRGGSGSGAGLQDQPPYHRGGAGGRDSLPLSRQHSASYHPHHGGDGAGELPRRRRSPSPRDRSERDRDRDREWEREKDRGDRHRGSREGSAGPALPRHDSVSKSGELPGGLVPNGRQQQQQQQQQQQPGSLLGSPTAELSRGSSRRYSDGAGGGGGGGGGADSTPNGVPAGVAAAAAVGVHASGGSVKGQPAAGAGQGLRGGEEGEASPPQGQEGPPASPGEVQPIMGAPLPGLPSWKLSQPQGQPAAAAGNGSAEAPPAAHSSPAAIKIAPPEAPGLDNILAGRFSPVSQGAGDATPTPPLSPMSSGGPVAAEQLEQQQQDTAASLPLAAEPAAALEAPAPAGGDMPAGRPQVLAAAAVPDGDAAAVVGSPAQPEASPKAQAAMVADAEVPAAALGGPAAANHVGQVQPAAAPPTEEGPAASPTKPITTPFETSAAQEPAAPQQQQQQRRRLGWGQGLARLKSAAGTAEQAQQQQPSSPGAPLPSPTGAAAPAGEQQQQQQEAEAAAGAAAALEAAAAIPALGQQAAEGRAGSPTPGAGAGAVLGSPPGLRVRTTPPPCPTEADVAAPAAAAAAPAAPAAAAAEEPAGAAEKQPAAPSKESIVGRIETLDHEIAELEKQLSELRADLARADQNEAKLSKALSKLELRPVKPLPAWSGSDVSDVPLSPDGSEEEPSEEEESVADSDEEMAEVAALPSPSASSTRLAPSQQPKRRGRGRRRAAAEAMEIDSAAAQPTGFAAKLGPAQRAALRAVHVATSTLASEGICLGVIRQSRQQALGARADFARLLPSQLLEQAEPIPGAAPATAELRVPAARASFKDLSQLPQYQANLESHARTARGVSRLLRQEYASLLRRHVERAVEFRERAEQYAAVREAKEESAQQQLQFQQQQQPLLEGLRRSHSTQSAGANGPLGSPTLARTGSHRTGRSGDIVRSDYEEKQAIATLQAIELVKHMTELPRQEVLSAREARWAALLDVSRRVWDPVRVEEERGWVRPWSEEEKRVFMDKFLVYHKEFAKIASHLPGRTVQEVVALYYAIQHTDEFSHTRRKYLLRKRREQADANSRRKNQDSVMGMSIADPSAFAHPTQPVHR